MAIVLIKLAMSVQVILTFSRCQSETTARKLANILIAKVINRILSLYICIYPIKSPRSPLTLCRNAYFYLKVMIVNGAHGLTQGNALNNVGEM